MRFDRTTVLVTGGGSGIGRETAIRCAEEGATVVAADIDREAGEGTASAIEEAGGDAASHRLDVRDTEALTGAIDATAEDGGLDVLVNNAGIGHPRSDVEEIDDETRDRVLAINVEGVWNGCRAAIPHFKQQGSGAIVNTASLAGLIGMPGGAAYSLSKGAVVNFTRAIAAELGSHGVRANAVCPGIVETPLVTGDRDPDEWPELRDRMAGEYPLGRLRQPEDIANAISFLASEEAAWITGHALVVDGGYSCS